MREVMHDEGSEVTEEIKVKKSVKKNKSDEMSIEDLPGVGSATAEKLKEVGYDDLMSIAVTNPSELMEGAGIGDNVAKRIIQVARKNLDIGFESAKNY